jgi:predicted transcriptional regulator
MNINHINTDNEAKMISAFVMAGMDCTGADTAEALKDDNMSWMNADDLADVLGWNKQTIGGVMRSLQRKGLIVDSGEPGPRGFTYLHDFFASDEAIDWYFGEGK